MLTRLRDETRELLDHHLTFVASHARMVQGSRVITRRVTCGYCGRTWDGIGFVVDRCARVERYTEEP